MPCSACVPLLLAVAIVFRNAAQATNPIFNDLDESSLTDPPQISFDETPKAKQTILEGKPLKLSCSVTAIPPPSVRWLRNGLPIAAGSSVDRNELEKVSNFGRKTVQMATTKSELTVDCVDPRTTGVYSCVGENGYKRITMNSTVTLEENNSMKPAVCVQKKRAKPYFFVPSPAKISVWTDIRMELTGSSAQLFCRAEGFPRPEITWYQHEESDEGEMVGRKKVGNDGSHLLLDNGDLLVKTSAGEAGAIYYECEAKNTFAKDSKMVMLVNVGSIQLGTHQWFHPLSMAQSQEVESDPPDKPQHPDVSPPRKQWRYGVSQSSEMDTSSAFKPRRDFDEMGLFEDRVADECCQKRCTYAYMKSFCCDEEERAAQLARLG